MSGKYFRFNDVLGYGWYVMRKNFWFFVGIGILWLIIGSAPLIINTFLQHIYPVELRYREMRDTLTTIICLIINIILGMGMIKITLSFCDERKPTMGTLFNFWDCFWRYLGTAILYCLLVFAGLILLVFPGIFWFFAGMLDRVCSVIFLGFPGIVRFLRMPVIVCSLILLGFPGIVWGVKFGLWPYFVIDKGLGPIAALKASSRTTMGVKWDLFGFGIVLGLINLVGLLYLIVGIFVTYPMVIVAHALVYRQLAAQTPELAEWGITQPLAAGDATNHFAAM